MTGSHFLDLSRRTFLAGSAAALALPALARDGSPSGLIAGTYAGEGGLGLYPLDSHAGGWSARPPIGAIRDASFGVRSTRHGLFYLLDETKQGALGIYDDLFRQRAVRPTFGEDPCHIALSSDERMIAVANYSSGNVALWMLDPRTGLLLGDAHRVQHEGRGPNTDRQAGPHAHWVGFSADGRWLHSVDLGADAIFAHRLAPGGHGFSETRIAYQAPGGSGPRHLARHPRTPVAYLVTELANSLIVLDAAPDGTFRARSSTSTLPSTFRGASNAAHIAIDAAGTRLYVSNRGHNSIAVFAVTPDGNVVLRQHADCGGDWPRFFLLREERGEMLVANERSGTIARLSIGRDGLLGAPVMGCKVPGVAFIAQR